MKDIPRDLNNAPGWCPVCQEVTHHFWLSPWARFKQRKGWRCYECGTNNYTDKQYPPTEVSDDTQ